MTHKHYDLKKDERYLQLLEQSFPNIADATTEIIIANWFDFQLSCHFFFLLCFAELCLLNSYIILVF